MKIDRLLGITIYILNHGKVSAKKLSERFEVSKRTIQRDIETLCIAGIPIASTAGADGGYSILDSFTLENKLINELDYTNIITALKGLCSAFDNKKIEDTLEKILSASNNTQSSIFLDFGALRDGDKTSERIKIIERAIANKTALEIEYTNSQNYISLRIIEPLALTYKWYSWYLFSYCTQKKDYRLFKLPRISKLIETNKPFTTKHQNINTLIENYFATDSYKYTDIKLFCKQEAKVLAMEYLSSNVICELEKGDVILHMRVVETERLWFSLIMGFGGMVKVLEPTEIAQKVYATAEKILNSYNE